MLQFQKTLLPLLAAIGLLFSLNAQAEKTRWYDVEVILFEQTNQSYRNSERWPVDYTLPDTNNSRGLKSSNSGNLVPFRRLSYDELQLRGDAGRIKRASDLKLIQHFGWRQPGLAENKAIAVRINEGKVEGSLRLILSRYLHIEADLLYREPQSGSAGEENYRVYRMKQSRRMRSAEKHYLDHPVFGMIVEIRPSK